MPEVGSSEVLVEVRELLEAVREVEPDNRGSLVEGVLARIQEGSRGDGRS